MRRGGGGFWAALVVLAWLLPSGVTSAQTILDDFEELSDWTASASDGARVEIARDGGHVGMSMRIDFDLGAGGYVIARKAFALTLPANYAFTFQIRGQAQPNSFQLKLIDRSGQNVWWYNQRGFAFPEDWRSVVVKKQRIEYAWGPAGGTPKQVAYIEFAIAAGMGGKGSVWIDDLRLEERPAAVRAETLPKVTASTFVPEHEPERIFDADAQTSWHSGTLAADQWVLVDFAKPRDYGGLVIDWDPEDYATSYEVQVSNDAENWTTAYSSTLGNGGRDYIYMPDAESRYVRLSLQQSSRGQGYGIRTLAVKPFEFSASLNQFFAAIAADAPVGTYPKYFAGQQTYWTVVGVSGDGTNALLNEEGMLEVGRNQFSVEPFLYVDGTLKSWNAVAITQELARGYLPIPSVTWQHDGLTLRITAFAAGKPGASTLYATYRVDSIAAEPHTVDLFLTIRPFQVVPPWQSLNMIGGVTPIKTLAFAGRTVTVNDDRTVVSLTPPEHFGAATFEEGPVTDFLQKDTVPPRTDVADTFGYASGALQYRLTLPPGGHDQVSIAVPFHPPDPAPAAVDAETAPAYVATKLSDTTGDWERVLGHVDFQLPASAERIEHTLKSTLAYILINRDGPAIEPGSRTYARAWIRDGAMISEALLQMGFTEEVREFIRWFARYQFPDGGIPCCVDRRGSDRVAENDSDGEFVFVVAEYYRYTRDIGFLNEMWPAVVGAVSHIEALREQGLIDVYRLPEKQAFYGLVPQSISHEGYSSHPVHSYWDDFFALRGLKDAAALAVAVGDEDRATRYGTLRDTFRNDVYASMTRSMAEHAIDYIPGSVELGDFDPSSTAIALTLGSEQAHLPEPALTHTFDAYWTHVQERQARTQGDEAYSPYELRNVSAFVRLGQRDRARELLDMLLAGQRPQAWNEWAEVVWRDPATPRFIGDMPHTWVGSSFIISLRDMFAYERDADRSLVVAAGIPDAWLDGGVGVTRLPTHYGILNYTLRSDGPTTLRLRLSGDLTLPAGYIVVRPPLTSPLKAVTVNGAAVQSFTGDAATITVFPAEVVLEH